MSKRSHDTAATLVVLPRHDGMDEEIDSSPVTIKSHVQKFIDVIYKGEYMSSKEKSRYDIGNFLYYTDNSMATALAKSKKKGGNLSAERTAVVTKL